MPPIIRRQEPERVFPPFEYSHLLDEANYGDWRDELVTKGYAVVEGAIPRHEALAIRSEIYDWMESFPMGFKRDDPATFTNEHMPIHIKGGMLHGYGIAHEDWAWKIRSAPGVVDAFAHVWGTPELVTSYDSAAVMLPHRKDIPKDQNKRWPHMDQSACRKGMHVVQGIVNLNECGPDDGGLLILEGSAKLIEEYFDVIGRGETRTWGPIDFYAFSEDQEDWFIERGCKWVKVCCRPGDLILWDSRAMHHNCMPSGSVDRVVTYVTMAPAKLLSDEDRRKRKIAFDNYLGTTHVPFDDIAIRPHEPGVRPETGLPDPCDTGIPKAPRVATERILKLAGVQKY